MIKIQEKIVQGKDIGFNRIILENKKVDMLILSHTNKKDKLKQRDSGLNHVLCNLAKQNNILLAIDLNELIKTQDKPQNSSQKFGILELEKSEGFSRKEKALILARMIQNLKLMNKAKNKFKLLNYKNKSQAFSFLLSLGASTEQAKE